ncbi:MAG: helix-hairpin-helix domain-containing protein, partial [Phycisphaerales bacterium]
AFKYPAEQGLTKLIAVHWQVGKNGTLTPRATMEPIQLAGTTVQHATLHNIDEILRKDIRVGDTVIVEKAGEIIPQVVGFKEDDRDGSQVSVTPPSVCPVCDGPVEKEGPKIYCVNPECPAQFREKVKWFAARDQMNIDGLGEKVVDQLVDAGLVKHFSDLYLLTSHDLLPLEGFAKKSADALIDSIAESKTRGFARVLSGVGIRLVGRATSKVIAKKYTNFSLLKEATFEELLALDDFGKITTETLYNAIHSSQGEELIAGEKAGSKLKKAEELGVEVWDERQLLTSFSG